MAIGMVPPALAVSMLYYGLASLDLLFSPWIGLATAALGGLLVYVASAALLAVCLAPRQPGWRLVPVADQTARRILLILEAFVAVYVLDVALVELGRALYVPLSVTVAQSFITSLAFTALLALLVLAVSVKIALDLLLRPSELYSVVPGILP